jgi:GDPmannose 4,6-dehydratase
MQQVQPDEIYNLAAQSHVAVSFEEPEYTANSDALGTLRLLEAIRILGLEKKTRFYQASTSELYGKVQEMPQRETTPFYPRSPYAAPSSTPTGSRSTTARPTASTPATASCSTTRARSAARPSSPARSPAPSPASSSACRRSSTSATSTPSATGATPRTTCEMQWLMLQQEQPDDFVIATGVQYSVRDFVGGSGTAEVGVDSSGALGEAGRVLVQIDPRYFRPAEVELLLGDPSKARRVLGWEPRVKFAGLVEMMVDADIKEQEREKYLLDGGYRIKSYHE